MPPKKKGVSAPHIAISTRSTRSRKVIEPIAAAPAKTKRKPVKKRVVSPKKRTTAKNIDQEESSSPDEDNMLAVEEKDTDDNKTSEESQDSDQKDEIEPKTEGYEVEKLSYHKKFGKFPIREEIIVKLDEDVTIRSESDDSQQDIVLSVDPENIESVIGAAANPNTISNYIDRTEPMEQDQELEEQEVISEQMEKLAVSPESEMMEDEAENIVIISEESPKSSDLIIENELECVSEEIILIEATYEENEDVKSEDDIKTENFEVMNEDEQFKLQEDKIIDQENESGIHVQVQHDNEEEEAKTCEDNEIKSEEPKIEELKMTDEDSDEVKLDEYVEVINDDEKSKIDKDVCMEEYVEVKTNEQEISDVKEIKVVADAEEQMYKEAEKIKKDEEIAMAEDPENFDVFEEDDCEELNLKIEPEDDKKMIKAPLKDDPKKPSSAKKPPRKSPKGKAIKGKEKEKTSEKPGKKGTLEKQNSDASESSSNSENSIRRSSRIKSISVLKQKSRGHGLVKTNVDNSESSSNNGHDDKITAVGSPNLSNESDQKPVKVKSRWRRTSELEMTHSPSVSKSNSPLNSGDNTNMSGMTNEEISEKEIAANKLEVERRLKQFVHLKENIYLTDRISCKEAKKMTCDCFLTSEEIERGEYGCGEDCLNRLLMIECGNLCAVEGRCTNKRFQNRQFSPCEAFNTREKGLGIRATANIPFGEFVMEYVGEVLDPDEFEKRATEYSKDKNQHYYFMSLRSDAVIDATFKGNISRFINHSCDPNAETQKWTVNGELRIGFFSKRLILAGEEITFDYQFQRYGKEAQKCLCGSSLCRGWLGEEPDEDDEDDEEDEEEDEEEEEEEEEKKPEEKVEVKVVEGDDKIEAVLEEISDEKISDKETAEVDTKMETEELTTEQAEVKKVVKKKEKKKILRQRKPRKDIFDNLDLDEEIETLLTTGLKNQAHTLKLSRLMVRAKEISQRSKLLSLLRQGELACRRLFLDYHGLRLVHGWMMDTTMETIRLEILQTLQQLPIPNKTMLQDSKVLPTVEKWSKNQESVESPVDGDSNSPKLELTETSESKKAPQEQVKKSPEVELSEIGADDMDISPIYEEKDGIIEEKLQETKLQISVKEEIVLLAIKLISSWSTLKEVFRIPKKERIEQMKVHEREADLKYKAGLNLEIDNDEKKAESRYRSLQRFSRPEKILELDRNRRGIRPDDKRGPRLSKYERRKLFALKVEQEEEEKRRQRDIWLQHEQRCLNMGTDPRFTAPFDPNRGYHCIWNPQSGQWQTIFPNPTQSGMITPTNTGNIMAQPFQMQQSPYMNPSFNAGQNMMMQSPQFKHMGQSIRPGISPIALGQVNMPPPIPNVQSTQPLGTAYQMYPNSPAVANLPNMSGIGPNMQNISTNSPYSGTPMKIGDKEDYSQTKFMGPIPPPVKLPPRWKCAKDKYGRPYYYHVKVRKAQWEPPDFNNPPVVDDASESESSSDTSSLSSDSSTEDSDDDEIDDNQLLRNIRNKFERMDQEASSSSKIVEKDPEKEALIDLLSGANDTPKKVQRAKKRRVGLVQEILISPRTEEDRMQFKQDLKRYKENKEEMKKEKEMLIIVEKQRKAEALAAYAKAKLKKEKAKALAKAKKESTPLSAEATRKLKDKFRANMASVMVSILNPYRKPDCPQGRITSTEDFKHLARKLTHFVMLKELKHIASIEDLNCNESVKSKAKEFVRKYMSKFKGEYHRDDVENE